MNCHIVELRMKETNVRPSQLKQLKKKASRGEACFHFAVNFRKQ